MQNRVVRLAKSGSKPELAIDKENLPEPGAGEVRLRMQSVGLNRADLLWQQNRYFSKAGSNAGVGFEGAGIVDATGPDTDIQVGQRFATCPMTIDPNIQGCLADYAVFKANQLIPTPFGLSDADAGAVWMAFLTAWGGLFDAADLQAKQSLLVSAASSSVGLAAIQLANQCGAKVMATSTSEAKLETLCSLGADAASLQPQEPDQFEQFDSALERFSAGEGIDLSFDAVAGPAIRCLVKGAKRGGTIVIHGLLDRREMPIHAGVLMKRLLTVKGYTLDQTLDKAQVRQRAITSLSKGFDEQSLRPIIARYFALDDFKEAFSYLASNQQIGKVVITP